MNLAPRRRPSARAEQLRREMDERIAERFRAWKAMYPVELFRPSFPPKLNLDQYPMRAASGALVLVGVSLGAEAWLRLVRYEAEDGSAFLEAAELPVPGEPRRFYHVSEFEWYQREHAEEFS